MEPAAGAPFADCPDEEMPLSPVLAGSSGLDGVFVLADPATLFCFAATISRASIVQPTHA